MCKFDEEVQVFYDRFDKAYENNDLKELAFFGQFTSEKDIRKWGGFIRRQICENARNQRYAEKCGITEVRLNDVGWLEWKIPGYEKQEFYPLGCVINRGCCNMKEEKALGVLRLPNGKWIAKVDMDYTKIGHSYLYLGIFDEQYKTKEEAQNNAIKKFVNHWHDSNMNIKKEDEAVVKAKSMITVGDITPVPKMKGEPIQLSLF